MQIHLRLSAAPSDSVGDASCIYMPKANGPIPILAVINGLAYAGHSDHRKMPRKLSNADGQHVAEASSR